MESFNSKVASSRADALLKSLIPATQELCASQEQDPALHQFLNTLISGSELVKSCESIGSLNVLCRRRCASQILKLEEEINGSMISIPAQMVPDFNHLLAALKDLYKELKPPDISSTLNVVIQQQMSLGKLCQSTEMEEAEKWCNIGNVPDKSRFYAGLGKPVEDLKELLLQPEVSVVGVHCMGGGGKTTLASAICNDPQIKGNNIERRMLGSRSQY